MKEFFVDMDDCTCQSLVRDAPWILQEVMKQKILDEAPPKKLVSQEAVAEQEAALMEEKFNKLDARLSRGLELIIAKIKPA